MKKLFALTLSFALILMVIAGMGCSKKVASSGPAEPVAPPPPAETEVETPATQTPVEVAPEPEKVEFEDIFFDFDKAELRTDGRNALMRNGEMLQRHPEVRILIEGHCDERGTREYNLALGDKRAKAALDFLVRFGIDAGRIEMISYGEERPFAMGHTEGAWALNRRAHFVIRD